MVGIKCSVNTDIKRWEHFVPNNPAASLAGKTICLLFISACPHYKALEDCSGPVFDSQHEALSAIVGATERAVDAARYNIDSPGVPELVTAFDELMSEKNALTKPSREAYSSARAALKASANGAAPFSWDPSWPSRIWRAFTLNMAVAKRTSTNSTMGDAFPLPKQQRGADASRGGSGALAAFGEDDSGSSIASSSKDSVTDSVGSLSSSGEGPALAATKRTPKHTVPATKAAPGKGRKNDLTDPAVLRVFPSDICYSAS